MFLSLLPANLQVSNGHLRLLRLPQANGQRRARALCRGFPGTDPPLLELPQPQPQEAPRFPVPFVLLKRHLLSPEPQFGLHHGPGVGEAPQPAQQPHRGQSHDGQVDIRGHHYGALQKRPHLVEKQRGAVPGKDLKRTGVTTRKAPEAVPSTEHRSHPRWEFRNLRLKTHSRNTCRALGGAGRGGADA